MRTVKTLTILLALTVGGASAQTIVCPPDAPPNVKLAAREVRRYVYLRTGTLSEIASDRTDRTIRLAVDPALTANPL